MTQPDAMLRLKQMKVRRANLLDHISDCQYPSEYTIEEIDAVEAEIKFIMNQHQISETDYRKWAQQDHKTRKHPNTVVHNQMEEFVKGINSSLR